MGRLLCLVVAIVAAVSAAGAYAAAADKEQHHFTAADQAAAKTAVVKKADLAAAAGWTGGLKAPDLSPAPTCANFHPKQSDLVLTGAAESDWKNTGLEIDTEAQVLQTEQMVTLDWQRTVADPAAFSCTKALVKKNFSKAGPIKFVSFIKLPFPRIGKHTQAFLTTLDVTSNGTTARVVVEDILIANRRTEISISSTTQAVEAKAVAAADVRLASVLVARAKA
ncbi:MAG TPA: hypothetical protein VFB25_03620 [Gaiellaceae bacterium]|nr:hypothetical protein [Gaiellaceae bacterium]